MSLKFTKDHEWLRAEGDAYVVGITSYAVEQLGDVVYVELPEIGRVVKAHEACAVVESAKAASDVYAPISGEITAINDALGAAPETVNAAPEAGGWFFKIKPANAAELDALMSHDGYQTYLKSL